MSSMSNTRMPRTRSVLTGSGTPPKPQSARLLVASDDMNSRFLYTDTSFCDAGHRYVLHQHRLRGFGDVVDLEAVVVALDRVLAR